MGHCNSYGISHSVKRLYNASRKWWYCRRKSGLLHFLRQSAAVIFYGSTSNFYGSPPRRRKSGEPRESEVKSMWGRISPPLHPHTQHCRKKKSSTAVENNTVAGPTAVNAVTNGIAASLCTAQHDFLRQCAYFLRQYCRRK